MEFNKTEIAIVEKIAGEMIDIQSQPENLDELQLAMVGGGSGDVGWL